MNWILALVIPGSALLGLLGTLAIERVSAGTSLVRAPDERSSHTVPTPRGGGLAIVVVALLACVTCGVLGQPVAWALAGLVAVTAALGFLDDLLDLSPLLRLGVQTMVLLALIWLCGALPPIPLIADGVIGGWVLIALVLLAGLWWINLFNFMDGIDGIAATQAIILLVAGSILSLGGMQTAMAPVFWLAWCSAAATAGFLLRNWAPARIFMGDVGSNALALIVFALALTSLATGLAGYPAWIILVSVSVSDTTVTLLRRLAQGKRPWKAHRSHGYQQLSRLRGHQATTLLFAGMTLLWALPLAWLAQAAPQAGWWLVLLAYAPLCGVMLWCGAGSAIERGKLG